MPQYSLNVVLVRGSSKEGLLLTMFLTFFNSVIQLEHRQVHSSLHTPQLLDFHFVHLGGPLRVLGMRPGCVVAKPSLAHIRLPRSEDGAQVVYSLEHSQDQPRFWIDAHRFCVTS